MNAVAWVGAIEAAIGILYLAIIGQRSIAQWLDDRRRPRLPAEDATPPQEVDPAPATPRPRLLSAQSIGAYLEYVWRDPIEAALVTVKALTLGTILLCGVATLLLWIGGLTVEAVAFFAGSSALDQVAGQMGMAGLNSGGLLLLAAFVAAIDLGGLYSLTDERKREQQQKEQEERRQATAQERAARRRAEGN